MSVLEVKPSKDQTAQRPYGWPIPLISTLRRLMENAQISLRAQPHHLLLIIHDGLPIKLLTGSLFLPVTHECKQDRECDFSQTQRQRTPEESLDKEEENMVNSSPGCRFVLACRNRRTRLEWPHTPADPEASKCRCLTFYNPKVCPQVQAKCSNPCLTTGLCRATHEKRTNRRLCYQSTST